MDRKYAPGFKAFSGTQFKPQYRGDRVVVVMQSDGDDRYALFFYDMDSEEYRHLVTERANDFPLDRLYLNINTGLERELGIAQSELERGEIDLDFMDRKFVQPEYLTQAESAPE